MKHLTFTLILILFNALFCTLQAQSLQEKYDEMMEKTETYEQYKVIPRTRLDGFWTEVTDTLKAKTNRIQDLRADGIAKQADIDALGSELSQVQSKLDESLELNDTIYFFGIPFSKLGYHLMVWILIIALAVLGIISYLTFLRSNKVTTRVKAEFETLESEFEKHKNGAREKQAKLKRELQTAINQLGERR